MYRVFRVWPSEDTRLDVEDDVLGWGVQFPSGECYVEWNRMVFDEDDQLEHPHVSRYGSLNDVEQGTGGTITEIQAYSGPGWSE